MFENTLWIAGAALIVIGVGMAAVFVVANRRWRADTRRLDVRVADSATTGAASAGPMEWLDPADLPAPVQRFRQRVLWTREGGPVDVARIWHRGEFRMGKGEDAWKRFHSIEVFRTCPPAFYWNATIRMLPLIPVRVRDWFIDGRGGMRARVGGVVSVMNMEGSPQLAEGALSRYLAEAAWFPTRLLTGPGLTWSEVDDFDADATLEADGVRVTLRFTFDPEGEITKVSGLRAREADGSFVDTPWVGRFSDYRVMDGEWIPTFGEVAWVMDGGEEAYWRGTTERAEYTRRS